jgi:hypothetical protein
MIELTSDIMIEVPSRSFLVIMKDGRVVKEMLG